MSIPFRIFLYIYCFIIISETKLERGAIKDTLKNVFCNPIIIAMLASMILWIAQPILPKIAIGDVNYSIFRIDKTVPWLYKSLSTIANLTMPLSMLLIGVTLGDIDIKSAETKSFLVLFGCLAIKVEQAKGKPNCDKFNNKTINGLMIEK